MELEGLVIPVNFQLGGLLAGIDKIKDLITGAVSSTFEWADGMDALGDVTGMSTDKLAAWQFVATKAGVSTDKLSKSMVIMEKGLIKTDGTLDKAGEKLQALGIKVFDANGEIRDQSALMDDIAAKYATFGTQQEKVNFLTEIFGRSGADLVDVFDTLAQEGGIDAVTQKVKDMGLAIDPDRYEQFQRNLEEIKLAGTGIAIQFTEKLMPALEWMLSWADSMRGKSPGEILANLGGMAEWLAAKFENWAARVDWAKVSADLIAGINSVDWAGIGARVGTFFTNIFNGLSIIVSQVDWKGIFNAVGLAFLNFMAGLTGQSSWNNVKATWSANLEALKAIGTNSLAALKAMFDGWHRDILNSFHNTWEEIKKTVLGVIDSIIKAIESIPSFGSGAGGTTGLKATGKASGGGAGGTTWVGERGPELVNLPPGSFVTNAQDSAAQTEFDYARLAKTLVAALQTAGAV